MKKMTKNQKKNEKNEVLARVMVLACDGWRRGSHGQLEVGPRRGPRLLVYYNVHHNRAMSKFSTNLVFIYCNHGEGFEVISIMKLYTRKRFMKEERSKKENFLFLNPSLLPVQPFNGLLESPSLPLVLLDKLHLNII